MSRKKIICCFVRTSDVSLRDATSSLGGPSSLRMNIVTHWHNDGLSSSCVVVVRHPLCGLPLIDMSWMVLTYLICETKEDVFEKLDCSCSVQQCRANHRGWW